MRKALFALFILFGTALTSAKEFRCATCLHAKQSKRSSPIAQAFLPRATNWTIGNKRIVVLRLSFPDRPEATPTEQQCREMMDHADRAMRFNSYGAFSLSATISPALALPKPESQFANSAELENTIWQLAAQAGFLRDDFDLDVIVGITPPGADGYAMVDGRGIQLRQAVPNSIIIHEIGHNLGLQHAKSWVAENDSISGAGESREYGDHFDVMGFGESALSSWSRQRLGWLGTNWIRRITTSETADIWYHQTDTIRSDATLAVRIPAGDVHYWIDCSLPTSQSPQTKDAIIVRWAPAEGVNGNTHLLDMRPETVLSTIDASLLLGRTFSDRKRKIHITPVAKHQSGFKVQVNIGDFRTNRSPTFAGPMPDVIDLQIGEPFQLSATATDSDGDPVYITWDFAVGSFGIGPNVTGTYYSAGEYSIVCEASDGKGGVTMKSIIARVGSPTSYRLSGIAMRSGKPLPNARIFVPGQEHLSARTGPDGRYMMPGLFPGTVALKAVIEGVELFPKFELPLQVSGSREMLDWQFPDVLADDLNFEVNEDSEETPTTLIGSAAVGPVTFQIQDFPKHGALTGHAPNLFYSPDSNFSGDDSFTYFTHDGTNPSLPATVSIKILPQIDSPIAVGQTNTGAEVVMTMRTPDRYIYEACAGVDSGIYTLGLKEARNGGDLVVRRFDSRGKADWERVLPRAEMNFAERMLPRRDGVLAQGTIGLNPSMPWLIRLSTRNEVLWSSALTNARVALAACRGEDAFLLAGSQGPSSFIAKLDGATGRELWRNPAPSGFWPRHLDIGDTGEIAATGFIGSRVATVKFSAVGHTLWNRTLTDPSVTYPAEVHLTSDGSLYVRAGGGGHTWITHYTADGDLRWQSEPLLGPAGDFAMPRTSTMVFDRDEVLHILADDPEPNWRTVLLKFNDQIPEQLWSSTNPAPNAAYSLRLMKSGAFEVVTLENIPENPRLYLTTIDPSGAEIANQRVHHNGGDWIGIRIVPGACDDAVFVVDGNPSDFQARITKIINPAASHAITTARDQSLTTWPTPISLDDQPIDVVVTDAPEHGTITGRWPNWTYTPARNFAGQDRIKFRAFQSDASTHGEFIVNVVAPIELRRNPRSDSATLTVDPQITGLDWSMDLNEWTPLRGPIPSTVDVTPNSPRFFRVRH